MKSKIRIATATFAALLISLLALPAMAGAHASSKNTEARGDIGYSAYGLQRSAKFDVEQISLNKCSPWSVNGTYAFDFEYSGGHYIHSITITNQDKNGNYTIAGSFPVGGPQEYAWNGIGNVTGSSLSNSVNYTLGAPGTHMDMTGTIAADGTMSGTWSDNFGGVRSGSWTTASGAATVVYGCKGQGNFKYSDANGDSYKATVKYVKVSGSDAWFAGKVTKASQPAWIGNWVFVKVHDGAPTGDQIWGSFTDETTAKKGVANMSNPADGPFAVSNGNIKVH